LVRFGNTGHIPVIPKYIYGYPYVNTLLYFIFSDFYEPDIRQWQFLRFTEGGSSTHIRPSSIFPMASSTMSTFSTGSPSKLAAFTSWIEVISTSPGSMPCICPRLSLSRAPKPTYGTGEPIRAQSTRQLAYGATNPSG